MSGRQSERLPEGEPTGRGGTNLATRQPARVNFPNLDGLRFLAFFVVFLSHWYDFAIRGSYDDADWPDVVRRAKKLIFESGGEAVSFFFVLSGFLITYLLMVEVRVHGRLDVRAFYARRFLRIWPLYYAVLCFGFFVYPWLQAHFGRSNYQNPAWWGYYFSFLGNFDLMTTPPPRELMTAITWSVAIEEQFYLVWPLVLFILPWKRYSWAFSLVLTASVVFRYSHADDYGVLNFHSLSVIGDMAVGGLGAYLASGPSRVMRWFSLLNRPAIVGGYLLGGALLVFGNEILTGPLWVAVHRPILACFFCFVVLEQNFATRSPLKMSSLPLLGRLGKYTYGLYLLHPIALACTWIVFLRAGLPVGRPVFVLLFGLCGLGLTILFSYFSYQWFESRFMRLKSRFSYVVRGTEGTKASPATPDVQPTMGARS